MPMIPSVLAAAAYAGVKVGGYATFAHVLNRRLDRMVSPLKFAGAKTALGLVGGITYVFALAPTAGISESSDTAMFIGAAPVRLAAWGAVIALFYGFRSNPWLMSAVMFAGVCWSYALDGIMWLIYRVLPGMVMPFC
jgi:hypothetical protein